MTRDSSKAVLLDPSQSPRVDASVNADSAGMQNQVVVQRLRFPDARSFDALTPALPASSGSLSYGYRSLGFHLAEEYARHCSGAVARTLGMAVYAVKRLSRRQVITPLMTSGLVDALASMATASPGSGDLTASSTILFSKRKYSVPGADRTVDVQVFSASLDELAVRQAVRNAVDVFLRDDGVRSRNVDRPVIVVSDENEVYCLASRDIRRRLRFTLLAATAFPEDAIPRNALKLESVESVSSRYLSASNLILDRPATDGESGGDAEFNRLVGRVVDRLEGHEIDDVVIARMATELMDDIAAGAWQSYASADFGQIQELVEAIASLKVLARSDMSAQSAHPADQWAPVNLD